MANATNNGPQQDSEWIPLMEYAMQYGVSLSTLRRHIKANKIPFKVDQGRYLIQAPEHPAMMPTQPNIGSSSVGSPSNAGLTTKATQVQIPSLPNGAPSSPEVRELQLKLQRAQEEISELKMLVAIYEEQMATPPRPASMRLNGY